MKSQYNMLLAKVFQFFIREIKNGCIRIYTNTWFIKRSAFDIKCFFLHQILFANEITIRCNINFDLMSKSLPKPFFSFLSSTYAFDFWISKTLRQLTRHTTACDELEFFQPITMRKGERFGDGIIFFSMAVVF